ncbi:MAG: Bax inhibitor-1/YccA family protein [Planctomycetota bacterium]|jgi:FtsH-binding integral membrane protein|nr:Bax inhibitor-1/YccA family protein [Planctomycetota bacterium]
MPGQSYRPNAFSDFPASHAETATKFLTRVYLWMFAGLMATTFVALAVAESETLPRLIFENRLAFWGLVVGELGLVMFLSGAVNKLSPAAAAVLFILYSVLNGATVSAVLLVYTGESLIRAFLSATLLFASMSAYGYVTRRDLASLGNLCLVGLFAVIASSILNLFLGSSGLDYFTSIIGILIFLGLTAYDTQKMLRIGDQATDGGEEALRKSAILGALALYLDFINLFLFLLRVFGKRR